MANLPPVLKQYWTDANGDPLAGGKIHTYQSGTTTPQASYTDASGGTPAANPIVLDSSGYAPMWLDPALSYKFVVTDSNDVTQHTIDDVIGLLTANAVPTEALQDDAVTQDKIANDAVGAGQLKDSASVDADRAVTTDHLRDLAVTGPKISSSASQPSRVSNVGISATASAGALTVALKQADGSTDPTSALPVMVGYRSTTITSGGFTVQSYTAAASVVIPSTATLGYANGDDARVYVYGIYDGTNKEIAVSPTPLDETALHSTTAITAGADDSGLYSTSARTGCAIHLLGVVTVGAITTAGTWTTPTKVALNSSFVQLIRANESYTAASSAFPLNTAGYASNEYALMTGNSLTLTPGDWVLRGSLALTYSSASDVTSMRGKFYGANGANTASEPALITTLTGASILEGNQNLLLNGVEAGTGFGTTVSLQDLKIRLTRTQVIYIVPSATFTTAGNADMYTSITATRVLPLS